MPGSQLRDICFDCANPHRVARFWAAMLGYALEDDSATPSPDEGAVIMPPREGPRIWFNKVPEPKVAKNRVHLDVNMQDDGEMERLLGLGARALQEIRADDGTLVWTIMADPEGNEFCAFPPHR